MKYNLTNLLIVLACLIKSLTAFYVPYDNEDSNVIATLRINYEPVMNNEFPKEFSINLDEFLQKSEKLEFSRIESLEDTHPIQSDDVYTLNQDGNVVKVNLASQIQDYQVYRQKDGESSATLIRNPDLNDNSHPFRLLATIHVRDSPEIFYNVAPIVNSNQTGQSKRKRSLGAYDSTLNSHAIFKRNINEMNFDEIISNVNRNVNNKKASRVKRSNNGQPFNLFVEYLIVADLSVYNDHVNYAQTSNQDLVFLYMRAYFAHYVNALNQRYQNSFANDADLRITVKLTNLLILTNPAQCQWTNSSLVGVAGYPTYNGREVVVTSATLNTFTNFMNSLQLNFTYDHAAGMFNKDLWSDGTGTPDTLSKTAGFASLGLICSNNRYSIQEEIGGFSNVFVGAHELGHNLGAYHDGLNELNGGDIYSKFCSASDNYLMTAILGVFTTNLVNNLRLSSCSINSIKNNLLTSGLSAVGQNALCLTNVVGTQPTDYLVANSLPGQSFTANDQCKMVYGSNSSFCQYAASSMCTILNCRTADSMTTGTCVNVPGRGAAPGTVCASGQSCIQGVCTSTSNVPSSACPFGDDVVIKAEIQQSLSYMRLPDLAATINSCEDTLSFFASKNYAPNAFCTDVRTSRYFRNTCCDTCRKYDSLTCADTLVDCPVYKSSCNSGLSFDGGKTFQTVSSLCPRTCNVCSNNLVCTNSTFLCQNGGTCTNVNNTNSLTGFVCTCQPGFTGPLCEISNPCIPNPCQNNGVCQRFGSLGYVCSCLKGYSGYNCSSIDQTNPCSTNPCLNNGQCLPSPNGINFTCTCPLGYVGSKCETFNVCLTNPCANGATCNSTVNSLNFSCTCAPGYTGSRCEIMINYCTSMPCLNGATCVSILNGYNCSCASGFFGSNCQSVNLTNPCASKPCLNGATCQPILSNFSASNFLCNCTPGYSGNLCQNFNPCFINPCLNGDCVANGTNFTCSCFQFWTGSRCEIFKNPCSSNPCGNNGQCSLSPNGYTCSCSSGYTGANCEMIINSCASTPCLNGATCSFNATGYTCSCRAGFTGTNCQAVITSPCISTPCRNGGTCQTNFNGYSCICPSGYSGINCQTSNICTPNPCLNNGACVQIGFSSAVCVCAPGFSGSLCQVKNVCFPNPCKNNGTCSLFGSQYFCSCLNGFAGTNCETNTNLVCSPTSCFNGATCSVDSSTNTTRCQCPAGFIGSRCESFFNPCFDSNNQQVCQNGATCITNYAQSPFYQCTCKFGYTGQNCSTVVSTTRFTVTTQTITNCTDQNSLTCQFYRNQNLCSNSFLINGVTVNSYCPRSCGLCGSSTRTSPPCLDSNSNCVVWSLVGFCPRLPDPNICRKSCGLC